jgi:rubrerythrin
MIEQGTYRCPICGKDTPHEHSGKEIGEYRAEEKAYWNGRQEEARLLAEQQLKRREEDKKHRRTSYEKQVEALRTYAANQTCNFCGWMDLGPGNLKRGCDWRYGFLVDTKEGVANCPECGKYVAAWD